MFDHFSIVRSVGLFLILSARVLKRKFPLQDSISIPKLLLPIVGNLQRFFVLRFFIISKASVNTDKRNLAYSIFSTRGYKYQQSLSRSYFLGTAEVKGLGIQAK